MSRIAIHRSLVAALTLAAAIAPGCTWVKPTEESGVVRLAEPSEVAGCQKVGSTTVSVATKVAFMQRGTNKVAGELETLARNAAAKKGADTIVAAGPPEAGEQDFELYRCGSGDDA